MKRTILFLALSMVTSVIGSAQSDSTSLTRIGDLAPVFTCKTINGKVVDISKLRGKVVMINFFATWCGPCNKELPVVQKNIWNKYKDNGDFTLIILGREHTEKEVSEFVAARHFAMPFAPDPGREIFKLYATQNIPRNVVIGKDGKIVYQSSGYTEEEFSKLENILAKELKVQ